jgi:hypothetical protein
VYSCNIMLRRGATRRCAARVFVRHATQRRCQAQGTCLAAVDNAVCVHARTRVWGELSPGARKQFVYPKPGVILTEDKRKFERDSPPGDQPPLDTFALVVLDVDSVDYVELFHNGRKEFEKTSDGWSETPLNP